MGYQGIEHGIACVSRTWLQHASWKCARVGCRCFSASTVSAARSSAMSNRHYDWFRIQCLKLSQQTNLSNLTAFVFHCLILQQVRAQPEFQTTESQPSPHVRTIYPSSLATQCSRLPCAQWLTPDQSGHFAFDMLQFSLVCMLVSLCVQPPSSTEIT